MSRAELRAQQGVFQRARSDSTPILTDVGETGKRSPNANLEIRMRLQGVGEIENAVAGEQLLIQVQFLHPDGCARYLSIVYQYSRSIWFSGQSSSPEFQIDASEIIHSATRPQQSGRRSMFIGRLPKLAIDVLS